MTRLYEIKARAYGILAVVTGLSVIGLMWYSLFVVWPAIIGLVIMIILQLVLLMFFLGNMVMTRVYANIDTLEK